MKKRILLLSGTSEGAPLARALLAAGFEVQATVTREEARANLFGPLLQSMLVEARGFTEESLTAFLGQREVDLVLDATHPFAVRITRLAHSVCRRLGFPYVRYERPDWEPPPGTRLVNSFSAAAELLPALGTRVLLTIGAKQLKHFVHLQGRLHLVARILPSVLSLQQALAAGFPTRIDLCAFDPRFLENLTGRFSRNCESIFWSPRHPAGRAASKRRCWRPATSASKCS